MGKTSFPWSARIGPKPGNSKPSISITLVLTKLNAFSEYSRYNMLKFVLDMGSNICNIRN